jgi:hypothetical protein
MEMPITLHWTDIRKLEGCCRNTASDRLKSYRKEYRKKESDFFTSVEYAAIKNILPKEVFIKLKIDYSNLDMKEIEALWIRYKKMLEEYRLENAQAV